MPDFIAAYSEARDGLIGVLADLPPHRLAEKVPACPEWSATDVIAHLVHVSETYAAGRAPYDTDDPDRFTAPDRADSERAAVDRWAQSGVDARRGRTTAELFEEWRRHSDGPLAEMMAGKRELPSGQSAEYLSWTVVGDLATHDNDLREALGLEPSRDAYATKLSFVSYGFLVSRRCERAGVPALRIVTQRGDLVLGVGDPGPSVEADWFETLRSITGRRTVGEVRDTFAGVDLDPYIDVISYYPYPASTTRA